MQIMIIIIEVESIMNRHNKYSHLDDLIRIKSGYMPKTHFIFLYDILTILIISKLFVYRICKNFIFGADENLVIPLRYSEPSQ